MRRGAGPLRWRRVTPQPGCWWPLGRCSPAAAMTAMLRGWGSSNRWFSQQAEAVSMQLYASGSVMASKHRIQAVVPCAKAGFDHDAAA